MLFGRHSNERCERGTVPFAQVVEDVLPSFYLNWMDVAPVKSIWMHFAGEDVFFGLANPILPCFGESFFDGSHLPRATAGLFQSFLRREECPQRGGFVAVDELGGTFRRMIAENLGGSLLGRLF